MYCNIKIKSVEFSFSQKYKKLEWKVEIVSHRARLFIVQESSTSTFRRSNGSILDDDSVFSSINPSNTAYKK